MLPGTKGKSAIEDFAGINMPFLPEYGGYEVEVVEDDHFRGTDQRMTRVSARGQFAFSDVVTCACLFLPVQ